MKKQILVLPMLLLALVFFTSHNSFGQQSNPEVDHLSAVPSYCVPAVPLLCTEGDGLSPVPGVSYTYTIAVNDLGTVHWFVTDDSNIMTAPGTLTGTIDPGNGTGDYLLTADITPGGTYNNATNTSVSIDLTWKPFDGNANEVLLVAYAVNAAGCTDNIEVYRIIPSYSFTLDLAGLLDNGTTGAAECVGPIQSASYDGTNLNVVYGDNWVFFTVNAANWQTSWETNLAASSDHPLSTLGNVEWAYPDQAVTGPWNASGTEVLASHYGSNVNGFIGPLGECIVVRVPVVHASATENITDEIINLVVNGEMINPQTTSYDGTYPDLDEAGAGNPCISDLTTDNVNYTITARPAITATNPTPFEPKTPTGGKQLTVFAFST